MPPPHLDYIGSCCFHSFLARAVHHHRRHGLPLYHGEGPDLDRISSDYVQYAEMAALPKRKILFSYLIRNTMLPQVTDLGLSLGTIFRAR